MKEGKERKKEGKIGRRKEKEKKKERERNRMILFNAYKETKLTCWSSEMRWFLDTGIRKRTIVFNHKHTMSLQIQRGKPLLFTGPEHLETKGKYKTRRSTY